MEGNYYQPDPYRPTFPVDFNGEVYGYRKKKYEDQVKPYRLSGCQGTPASPDNIDTLLKADLYITGQTIENIIGMIGMRTFLKKKIRSELDHLRGEVQDRITETMYTGDRVPTMVKRRGDLEKQLLQLDMEGLKEEQTVWKDISMLSKELRYKLEQYRREKAKEGLF